LSSKFQATTFYILLLAAGRRCPPTGTAQGLLWDCVNHGLKWTPIFKLNLFSKHWNFLPALRRAVGIGDKNWNFRSFDIFRRKIRYWSYVSWWLDKFELKLSASVIVCSSMAMTMEFEALFYGCKKLKCI
jgi:hypothetical protein